jgi:hypothetical protein
MFDIRERTRAMIEDAWEFWPKRRKSDTQEMFRFFLDPATRNLLSQRANADKETKKHKHFGPRKRRKTSDE